MKNSFKFITLLVAVVFILAGCSGKITRDNYNKISTGMTISQVEEILGKGESQASTSIDLGNFGGLMSSEVVTWQRGTRVITITFSDGEVIAKAQAGL